GCESVCSFNPRARVGRDTARSRNFSTPMFQSTRPRGARHMVYDYQQQAAQCFNPRARVGRDISASVIRTRSAVSIHAPAWGATQALAVPGVHVVVSI